MQFKKFVDRLPIPPVIKSRKTTKNNPYVVSMVQTRHQFHQNLPKTKVWAYNGLVPGPTFEVKKDKPIYVKWKNKLPKKHFLPIDTTIHGASHNPEVRTVVHLHGSPSTPASDGHPEAWFTKNFGQTGAEFVTKTYKYPNRERATTLWYHDHALGITRLNVYAGLAGLYLIRDEEEKALPLPKGKYEVPLIVQDKSFNPDGSLLYPAQPSNPSPDLPFPSIVPGFFGETIVVNGKVWPYLNVEPRKYRFRIVNASNSRAYQFQLSNSQSFFLIGTDGGLLERPIEVQSLLVGSAERIDIVVDFSKLQGETIILQNQFELGNPTGDVMAFKVTKPLKGKDNSQVPAILSNIDHIPLTEVKKVRHLTLVETQDEFGRPMLLLDGKEWDDPVTETPLLDSVEIWELENITDGGHPIHLHLVDFLVLERRDSNGNFKQPLPTDFGLKDTVTVNAGETVRIIMRFEPFAGKYVWHCHKLEHEDHDMMRPLTIRKH
ncbi:multicopper oxidase family protein [Peribacillus simplex]|uniref:multicopper oxidase family protein n=1 Tax=Peribacillus simplex TaxID=1478 RepID=UPI0024C1FB97|nr:multicopper oxidase [Peribacillus simplex]WHY59475.1 multicopper oxidase [Peribacillus simplex]